MASIFNASDKKKQGGGIFDPEEFIYDDRGVLENPGFLDYRVPLASDLPMIETIVVEVPNELHPHGVRGVGEAPIIPPLAAVAGAVSNAIGVRITETPCSPPKVLADCKARLNSAPYRSTGKSVWLGSNEIVKLTIVLASKSSSGKSNPSPSSTILSGTTYSTSASCASFS